MSIRALFGLSILMSFVAFGLVTGLFIWPRLRVMAQMLGAAFFIPTVFVPAALITHGLIFWLLVRPAASR
jgi:hypothetical protein